MTPGRRQLLRAQRQGRVDAEQAQRLIVHRQVRRRMPARSAHYRTGPRGSAAPLPAGTKMTLLISSAIRLGSLSGRSSPASSSPTTSSPLRANSVAQARTECRRRCCRLVAFDEPGHASSTSLETALPAYRCHPRAALKYRPDPCRQCPPQRRWPQVRAASPPRSPPNATVAVVFTGPQAPWPPGWRSRRRCRMTIGQRRGRGRHRRCLLSRR